ncbi:MAG: NAD(P)H-dependent glycerol-3-phosphate dehydrogenase [Lachnospiraceae bacterium]|nr:NAD(P)H-dependent glycerol-3-phosphate dehydrogenase [Lachnospiraceae bacterium]MBP3608876.1 NAD(P)H-dependent glycerol-3-phosphate dehydrogenase [Lachnospiraceae bacterium]
MKVSVLGAGTWGTALAILLAENKHEVTIWSALPKEVEELDKNRASIKNLPGAVLQDSVVVTADLEQALKAPEMIVMAVASVFVRQTANRISSLIPKGMIIVNVAKGVEEATLKTLTEVIEDEIPQAEVAVLSGPSHAEEVSRKIPTTIVAGAKKKQVADKIQDAFMNEFFRVYTSPDVIGIELGGSLKNVIALAAGVLDGLGLGDNTKAALMTRGIAEISRLGMAMGGKYETFAGLSGMGDLMVTCTSKHSRNRNAGFLIGQGKTPEEAMKEVNQVVEGVLSAKAAYKLGQKYEVELPIVEQVNKVLFENKSVKEAMYDLLIRQKTEEHSALIWEE